MGRAVIGCLSRNSIALTEPVKPSYGQGEGTTLVYLRLAYYLGTVLSAVLTTDSSRRERITPSAEAYSAPLRSGALRPTFFNEVVMGGDTVLALFS